MDYGRDPSLGWRFTDAWLSMAGASDEHSNGIPVDEWNQGGGRQVHARGRLDVAAGEAPPIRRRPVFALTKYRLDEEATRRRRRSRLLRSGPVPAQGEIAQQIFTSTAFAAGSY
jgi:glycerol transport system substrate-binding protein